MKTIKLTVEHARELFSKMPETRTTILHEFTDAELGIKPQPFKWWNLETVEGYFIDDDSHIVKAKFNANAYHRNTYPCGEDAQQALAKCMVLQLAYHYNRCHQHEIPHEVPQAYFCYYCYEDKRFLWIKEMHSSTMGKVRFIRVKDLQKCIDDNEALFKTMLGVRD